MKRELIAKVWNRIKEVREADGVLDKVFKDDFNEYGQHVMDAVREIIEDDDCPLYTDDITENPEYWNWENKKMIWDNFIDAIASLEHIYGDLEDWMDPTMYNEDEDSSVSLFAEGLANKTMANYRDWVNENEPEVVRENMEATDYRDWNVDVISAMENFQEIPEDIQDRVIDNAVDRYMEKFQKYWEDRDNEGQIQEN